MANPMKVVKAAKRLVVGSNKDIKTNKGINKKLEKMLNTSAISQGKAKVNKNVRIFNQGVEDRTGGTIGHIYRKGKMIEVNNNYPPIKVKPRNIGKLTKQMLPSKKKETKSINKIIKKQGKAIKPNVMGNPRSAIKVPVKKRGN